MSFFDWLAGLLDKDESGDVIYLDLSTIYSPT